jgi:hypothetical protein
MAFGMADDLFHIPQHHPSHFSPMMSMMMMNPFDPFGFHSNPHPQQSHQQNHHLHHQQQFPRIDPFEQMHQRLNAQIGFPSSVDPFGNSPFGAFDSSHLGIQGGGSFQTYSSSSSSYSSGGQTVSTSTQVTINNGKKVTTTKKLSVMPTGAKNQRKMSERKMFREVLTPLGLEALIPRLLD